MMTPRLSRRSLVPWSFAAAAVLGACNLHNEGVSPPEAALSYPIAVALSREPSPQAPRFLYVANSNFDLRYNAGSVHTYDLNKLDELLGKYMCRTLDEDVQLSDAGTRFVPDNTRYLDASIDAGAPDAGSLDGGMSLPDGGVAFVDAGVVDAGGAVADAGMGGIALSPDYAAPTEYGNKRGSLCDGRDSEAYARCCFSTRTDEEAQSVGDRGLDQIRASSHRIDSFATGVALSPSGNRLYVPISSRARLIYLDVGEGQLDCATSGRCTRGPGVDRGDDDPDNDFPGQPTAIATGTLGDLGLVAPQSGLTPDTPIIITAHTRGSISVLVEKDGVPVLEHVLKGFPQRPSSVTIDPQTKLVYATFEREAFISRIALRLDLEAYAKEQQPRELLYETSRIALTGIAQPRDLRDLAIDPNDPTRLYALIRGTQQSVAFLQVDPSAPANTEARVIDAVRVGAGPSKLDLITMGGRSFLLVSCYDAKMIYIIDVASREAVAFVRNLSGPHEVAFDAARGLLHVSDFRASVLRVVDLSGLVDERKPPPRIVATLGSPQFEGGLE